MKRMFKHVKSLLFRSTADSNSEHPIEQEKPVECLIVPVLTDSESDDDAMMPFIQTKLNSFSMHQKVVLTDLQISEMEKNMDEIERNMLFELNYTKGNRTILECDLAIPPRYTQIVCNESMPPISIEPTCSELSPTYLDNRKDNVADNYDGLLQSDIMPQSLNMVEHSVFDNKESQAESDNKPSVSHSVAEKSCKRLQLKKSTGSSSGCKQFANWTKQKGIRNVNGLKQKNLPKPSMKIKHAKSAVNPHFKKFLKSKQ